MKRLILSVAAMILFAGQANAALLDSQSVRSSWHFPSLGSIIQTVDVVVGPGLEIPGFSGGFAINLADASITFSNPTAGGYSSTAFNGWQFFDHTGSIAAITSVTINPATNMVGFDASRISFDANNIFVNFQGLPMNASTIVQLDINGGSTVVPEPSSLLLAGLGMFGIFGLRRRRRP